MKKLTLVAIILLSAFASVHAQQNAVKINILSPIVRTLNLSYERVIQENGSFQLGFFYTGTSISSVKYTGIGITPEYRFYLSETEAPEGFYVAPFVRYQNVKLTEDETTYEATLSSFGGGVVVGKQWLFKERVTLDLFIGPSYNSATIDVKSGDSSENVSGAFDGFGLRTGLTLGIAF